MAIGSPFHRSPHADRHRRLSVADLVEVTGRHDRASSGDDEAEAELETSVTFGTRRFSRLAGTGADVGLKKKQWHARSLTGAQYRSSSSP